MANAPAGDDELYLHLDVAGLAALMKTVEAAMTDGRGHLTLPGDGGILVGKDGIPRHIASVTVTFTDPTRPSDPRWKPPSRPRRPFLELLD